MNHKILHHLTIPGESAAYRAARNKLLAEEIALRRQIESVATLRRALPAGGTVAQDYLFDGIDGPLKLSELFKPGMDTMAIYNFMYGYGRLKTFVGEWLTRGELVTVRISRMTRHRPTYLCGAAHRHSHCDCLSFKMRKRAVQRCLPKLSI